MIHGAFASCGNVIRYALPWHNMLDVKRFPAGCEGVRGIRKACHQWLTGAEPWREYYVSKLMLTIVGPALICPACNTCLQPLVHVSPMSMMVAVAVWPSPPPQHSPMFGHLWRVNAARMSQRSNKVLTMDPRGGQVVEQVLDPPQPTWISAHLWDHMHCAQCANHHSPQRPVTR